MKKVKEIKLSVISDMKKKQNDAAEEDDENKKEKKEKKENENKNNNIDLQIAGFNKNQNVIQIS